MEPTIKVAAGSAHNPIVFLRLAIHKIVPLVLLLIVVTDMQGQHALKPIRKVTVGKNRELLVNGQPFLPIMSWAQPTKNYGQLAGLGFNTHAGHAAPEVAWEHGAYVVPDFKEEKKGHENILGWIFDD